MTKDHFHITNNTKLSPSLEYHQSEIEEDNEIKLTKTTTTIQPEIIKLKEEDVITKSEETKQNIMQTKQNSTSAPSVNTIKGQNIKPHLFDGLSFSTEQEELVSFIQNLMQQAKKEQDKLENQDYIEKKVNVNVANSTTKSTSTPPSTSLTPARRTVSTTLPTTTAQTAPILPFRTTLRTTTTATSATTTTDGTPQGVITRLLSEAAAPIAGLSAATLAYSAAAMLPVWLPAAIGRKKKSFEISDINKFQNTFDEKLFKNIEK